MKTTLPNQITSELEAKKYLSNLAKNDELYHPDDPAEDIIDQNGNPLCTPEEAHKLNSLMKQVFEHLSDPCEYILSLMIKFNDEGIEEPFEITGMFSNRHGINIFTPGWFESDEAADWYANNWEMVEDALNDPYRD